MSMEDTKLASPTLNATQSLMPFMAGDAMSENKARYLSYRYTGFSIREACEMADIKESTVRRWRGTYGGSAIKYRDQLFIDIEAACTGENRGAIRREVLHLHFTRNLMLFMRRDHEVLRRVLGFERDTDDNVVIPSRDDINYASRARSMYGPEQLKVLETLLDPSEAEAKFDFGEFVLEATTTEQGAAIRIRASGKPSN